MQNNYH